jgi:serine/threonine protein kinase
VNLIGQTIDGRYRIDAFIGQGGMAYVYLAHDLEADHEVAIKVLLPRLTIDQDSVQRLRREAVIAMRLHHPNVCNILAVGETDELPIYLVMPYFAGEPLALRELRGGLDWRSDQYALGVLGFEMFTGRVPFEGKTPQEVTLARLTRRPRPLRELRPDLSEQLEQVISRTLAREPGDRFPSMQETRAAFVSLLPKPGVFGRLFR